MKSIYCVMLLLTVVFLLVKKCIPLTGHNLKKKYVPGWVEQVAPQRERSLLWHWIWQEAGKPNNGHIYHIMKHTRH